MGNLAEAGRKEMASDCWVRFEEKDKGGLSIEVKSKVKSLYGDSIKNTALDMLKSFKIQNAYLQIEDLGSLPYVLTARIEAAVKKCISSVKEEYLAPFISQNHYRIKRDHIRRSRLYIPGDQPRLLINAGLFKPDSIILDLEDAVAPAEKEAARFIVRNALREVDFLGAERIVRINPWPLGKKDLDFIIPHGVHTICIPKCEKEKNVKEIDDYIQVLRKQHKIKKEIFLMPIIESALGTINAYEIAAASSNNVALTIGLEDFTADIGTDRTAEGKESLFARQQIVLAARAAGIQPLDSVFSDVTDENGLRKSILEAKSLGFEGKGCIHPGQIKTVHEAFAPTNSEIELAKKISRTLEQAQKRGSGVAALGSKMIDPPVAKRAERILRLAVLNNQIPENWKEK